MFKIVRDRVMTTRELLYSEMRPNDPTYDKLYGSCFIAAAIEEETVGNRKRWGLYLDEAPLVVLKDKMRDELGLHPDTPTVNQMRDFGKVEIGREKMPYGRFSLISGGVIVYYDGKLLCLKRDRFAPQDPGCLTTPAGRMSEWLSTMSSLELAEEMIIVVKHSKTGKLMTLGGYRQGCNQLSESDILVKKLKQLNQMRDFFSDKPTGEAEILEQIKGIDDIIPIDLDRFICQNMLDERSDQVFTFDNYKVKDQCSGYVFLDKKNNTLEYREVFDLTLPGLDLYAILPGEFFSVGDKRVANDTQILTKQELISGMSDGSVGAVPTLKAYLGRLDQVLNFFNTIKSSARN